MRPRDGRGRNFTIYISFILEMLQTKNGYWPFSFPEEINFKKIKLLRHDTR